MGLLQRLFPGREPPPLLFRVRLPSGPLAQGAVLVRGTVAHDGRSFQVRPVAAQGVVLVPWPGGRQAVFVLEKGAAAGRITLTRDEASTGSVHEILLA